MLKILFLFLLVTFSGMLCAKNTNEVKIQLAEGNYQQVIHLCDSILIDHSDNVMAWQYKGLAEKALYKYDAALRSYKKAYELHPTSISFLYSIGRLQELGGAIETAKETYLEVLQIDSLHQNTLSHLASLYRSKKDYIRAMDLYSKLVEQDSTNAYFYAQLGYCCLKSEIVLPGFTYYIQAIELNPIDFKSKMSLVRNMIHYKYYEDANFWIDTFLIQYPNNIPLLKQQAYLEALGGNSIKAIKKYENLLALGDTSLATCKYYGQSLYNNREYDKAAVWLGRFVEKKPDDAANHLILSLAYQHAYQYEKSLEHLDMTLYLKYDPKLLARIYREKAHTYIEYGDYVGYRDSIKHRKAEYYQLVVDFFLKSESVYPGYVGVYEELGQFYMRKADNPQLALYYFQKYYDVVDSRTLKDWELDNLQEYIEKLKEEVHFIGE